MTLGGGHYDVARVGLLVQRGRVIATKRVVQWLSNHEYDAAAKMREVLAAIDEDATFVKSCILDNEETADVYIVRLPDDDWYLKFWIDEDNLMVDVWSCWWDGAAH